jgi:hypothetical protein
LRRSGRQGGDQRKDSEHDETPPKDSFTMPDRSQDVQKL